jgi:hypothetical protein
MATLAILANGAKFQRGDSATPTEAFTDIPEVVSVTTGAGTAPDIDVSHLGSIAREKRAGLPDYGQMTAVMNYVQGNAVQIAMEAEAGTNVQRNYRIVFPDTTHGRLFSLNLKTFALSGFAVDGKIEATATFSVSGKPTVVTIP